MIQAIAAKITEWKEQKEAGLDEKPQKGKKSAVFDNPEVGLSFHSVAKT
jgi:hypothetical protein